MLMVLTRNMIIVIVSVVAAVGIGFDLYNSLSADTPSSQLQRARFGQDKNPSPFDLLNSTSAGRGLLEQAGEKYQLAYQGYFKNPPKTSPELFDRDNETDLLFWKNTNVATIYDTDYLAYEEEQLEPQALC